MPFQVIPRELAFYDLFEQAAAGVEAGARELQALIDDLGNAEARAERVTDLEHAGDDLTHRIMNLLNTTFVVPLDRHDIHNIASSLDDVLDHIEALADLVSLLKIRESIPQFRQQVDVLVRLTEAVRMAVGDLRDLPSLERRVAEIKRLEREGDFVYRRGVQALYSGRYDELQVLVWKDLLEEAERAIDRCEDIANTIESVVLKQA